LPEDARKCNQFPFCDVGFIVERPLDVGVATRRVSGVEDEAS
jgi:hypothetical protein